MLLQLERVQVATAEMDKAELVLQYMLRGNWSSMITRATRRRGFSASSAQWS